MNQNNYVKYARILVISLIIETGIIIFGIVYLLSVRASDGLVVNENTRSNFYYTFNVEEILEETNSMDKSPSPYWWVNSGGYLLVSSGVGKTPDGEEPASSKWHTLYAKNNPTDTDGGYHPQNLFRMITKSKWQDFRQEAYFKIREYNISSSQNRNLSNGIFILSRYQDGDNTYYAGIRVDGSVIIKKKVNGTYFTLAEKKIFEGVYDRQSNPIIVPENVWIGLQSEVKNISDDKVIIRVFTDISKTGTWDKVLEVYDDGEIGGEVLVESGFSGIRTDFMDVEFSDYINTEI